MGSEKSSAGVMDMEAFGRAVIEEVLFRAGLETPAGSADAASTSLEFHILADEPGRSLDVSFDRIGGTPVRFRVSLDNS